MVNLDIISKKIVDVIIVVVLTISYLFSVIDLSKVNGTESTDTLFLGFSSFSNLKFQIDHLQINGTNGTETSMKCHFTFSSHAQVISVNLTEAGYSVELNGQTHTWTLDKQINKELVTATIDNNKL